MRVPVPPIAGGLFEGVSENRQPRGTYLSGQNVRSRDPKTGKLCWGAQRAGLVSIGEATGTAGVPTHLFQAERAVTRERWVDLTTTPAASTSPSSVGFPWGAGTALEGAEVEDVAAGLDGLGYYLLSSGEVVIVNASGGESERIPSQTRFGYRTVPRIAVDADGGVFVASTRDEADEEAGLPAAYMARLVKSSEDSWAPAWETEFENRVSMFAYGNGFLYVVEDPPDPLDGDRPPAALIRLAAPLAVPSVAWRVEPLPRPVFDVTVGRGGSCLVSCPASPLRFSVDGTAFTARSVTWTPHNLVAAESKLWAWLSADYVNDQESAANDGDAVAVMNDRRKLANPYVEVGGATRDARVPVGFFTAPSFDAEAFGGLGGVRFEGQSALRSGRNLGATEEEQLALVPGDDGYAIVMVVQLDEASIASPAVRSLLSQRTAAAGQVDLFVLTNGPDIYAGDEAGGPVLTSAVDVTVASPGGSHAAIVTLRATAAASPPGWRVNGTAAAAGAAWPNLDSFGPYQVGSIAGSLVSGPATVIGEGNPNETNLLANPAVALTLSGTHPLASPGRLVDGTLLTSIDFLYTASVFARLDADFGAAQEMDSVQLSVTCDTVRVHVASDAAYTATIYDETFYLYNRPRKHISGALFEYELRLSSAIPISGRYVRFEFSTVGKTIETLTVAEVSLRAQDLNRSLQPDSWALQEMVVLRSTSLADVEQIEGYFARKVGLLHELDAGHPYKSTWISVAGDIVDPGAVQSKMLSPFPLLVKYGTDGTAVAVEVSAGVGLGAVVHDDWVLTWGEPNPYGAGGAPNNGTMARKIKDTGRAFSATGGWLLAAGSEYPQVAPTRLATGPCGSLFAPYRPRPGATGSAGVRRYSFAAGALRWDLATPLIPVAVAPSGLFVDETLTGGACGPEFLFLGTVGGPRAHRIDVTGRFDTAVPDYIEISTLRVDTLGDVRRLNESTGAWDMVLAGALTGERPWSSSLYGLTILGDGRRYYVWDHANKTLRDFAAAVKGYLPPRAKLSVAHLGRQYLAAADNPYALYASRYGKPFDFDLGPIIEDVAQAVAGTTSIQGSTPERITALMPWTDDVLLIGTDRRQYAITGDLAAGGTLDVVDRSNGVAFGYAWCHGSRGLYFFSANGGLWLRAGSGAQLISREALQRRFEDIDQRANRIELAYRWQDSTVHIFVIPRVGYQPDIEHFVYDESVGKFHPDRFGGGVLRQVTAVSTLDGQTAAERSLMLGFADGRVRRFASEADDDDGVPVDSGAVIGPLLPPEEMREASVRAIFGQLASSGGPVDVSIRASESADAPGPILETGRLEPGRGRGVTVRGSGAAVFVDVRGTGRAWAVHEMDLEGQVAGVKGSKR